MNKQLIELIDLPKIYDPRGSLTVAEENIHMPFCIESVEWTKININTSSAATSPYPTITSKAPIILVALAGKISLHIESCQIWRGNKDKVPNTLYDQDFTLDNPHQGLIISAQCSLKITNASMEAVLLKIKGNELQSCNIAKKPIK